MSVDVNKPLENPKLKELFLKKKSPLNNDEFNSLMNELCEEIAMNAYFLSVIHMSNEPKQNDDSTSIIEEGTTISFVLIQTTENKSFYPVFTDWDELNKWEGLKGTDIKTLVLSFDDYCSMVLDSDKAEGIVINPFNDNFVINRDFMTHLKSRKELETTGHTEITAKKDTKVILGEPENYPTDMTEAIIKAVKKYKNINRLWLRLMQRDNEMSYLIVTDFIGDRNDAFELIVEAAKPYLNNMYIDLIPYGDTFSVDAVKDVEPFYKRKNGIFRR